MRPDSKTSAPTAFLSGRNRRPKAGGQPFWVLPAAASRRPVARSHPFRVLTRFIQGFIEDLGSEPFLNSMELFAALIVFVCKGAGRSEMLGKVHPMLFSAI